MYLKLAILFIALPFQIMLNSVFLSVETSDANDLSMAMDHKSSMEEDCCEYTTTHHEDNDDDCCPEDQGDADCNTSDCNGITCTFSGFQLLFFSQNPKFTFFSHPTNRGLDKLNLYSSVDINAIWDPPRIIS